MKKQQTCAWILWLLLISCFSAGSVVAAPVFPKLSGRVVDTAGMLDAAAEQRIDNLLKGHESASTNQVVVVTVNDLGGDVIENYGYQLGRHWGIGQKGKDNGVLLIVAKKERKVRIEVGYGLEGTLTDALSSNIIYTLIVPSFKKGQFSQGIESGATAIVQALGGQYTVRKAKKKKTSLFDLIKFIFLVVFILFSLYQRSTGRFIGGGYYGGSGGRGGGGFSGGGGGFGGGGASGGW